MLNNFVNPFSGCPEYTRQPELVREPVVPSIFVQQL